MTPRFFTFLICFFLVPFSIAETDTGTNSSSISRPVILVLGDSLSAGFGIDQSQNWVSLMEKQLKDKGYPHVVINASISGETTSGGLSRLPKLLKQHPGIVIIELGANDGLRGLPLTLMKENLEKMITLSRSFDAEILLLGMKLPPNYGPAYANGFQEIYQKLAREHDTKLVPFFLSGIATQRNLMQNDNLHPTTEAQPLILKNIWPQLIPLIRQTTIKQSGDRN